MLAVAAGSGDGAGDLAGGATAPVTLVGSSAGSGDLEGTVEIGHRFFPPRPGGSARIDDGRGAAAGARRGRVAGAAPHW
jgi:hypothetical protein